MDKTVEMRRTSAVVNACSALLVLSATLVLIGWRFDVSTLKSVLPGFISMKANTAVCFLLFAFALQPLPRVARLVICLLVAAINGLTLAEYLTGFDFGIDQLLFKDVAVAGSKIPPGRLAPATATCFLLLSAAVGLGLRRTSAVRAPQLLALGVVVVAMHALLGYMFGISYSFGYAYYTQMAVHTSVLFIAGSAGVLWLSPRAGVMMLLSAESLGGVTARRLVVTAVLVPPFVNWLQMLGQRAGLFDENFGVLLRVVGNSVFFTLLVWRNASALHEADEDRRGLMLRKFQDAAAAQNAERFRSVFAQAFDAVISVDDAGLVVDWNARAEAMFGWAEAEAVGRRLSELIVPPELRAAHEAGMQRYLGTGASRVLDRSLELEALRRGGERFPARLSITMVEVGGRKTFTAFLADVTVQRKQESELRESRQIALDAARSKAEFLANMSHEIRTPLNGVLGMTDLLLDTGLSDEQGRLARIVQQSGNHLLQVVNDVLDFSKIEAGKIELEALAFDLAATVEAQVDILSSKARMKHLILTTDIDPMLPAVVVGDSGRLGQILLNLIGNALKFTETGRVFVRVGRGGAADFVRFEVEDTGIGLDPAAQSRLFRPFTQADGSMARRFGGTGLGLSISNQLVTLMGGRIGVFGATGTGSTFWLEVPLPAGEGKIRAPLGGGTRALIVDPDAVSGAIAARYLTAWGIEAVRSTTAGPADLARHSPCEIALISAASVAEVCDSAAAVHAAWGGSVRRLVLALPVDGLADRAAAAALGIDAIVSAPLKQSELFDAIVAVVSSAASDPAHAAAPHEPKPSPERELARILVAEDNQVNQLLVVSLLGKLGYTAVVAANGVEAVEAAARQRFAAILMDCQMPEMDGFEATRRIRAQEAERGGRVPIIALTANAFKEDEARCIAAGMDAYLSKPLKRDRLEAVLAAWTKDLALSA